MNRSFSYSQHFGNDSYLMLIPTEIYSTSLVMRSSDTHVLIPVINVYK